jgi:hypothetical protein
MGLLLPVRGDLCHRRYTKRSSATPNAGNRRIIYSFGVFQPVLRHLPQPNRKDGGTCD